MLLCLAVGLAPALVAGPLLAVAAQAALYGAPGPALPAYQLAIWHGFNGALLMSAVAVAAGVRALIWMMPVPSCTFEVWAPHHASGVIASLP